MPPKDKDKDDLFSGMNPDELPEDLKPVYKSMQADYTRKTQAIAAERTDFAAEREGFETKLTEFGTLQERDRQWQAWYDGLADGVKDGTGGGTDGGEPDPDKDLTDLTGYDMDGDTEVVKLIKSLDDKITGLRGEIESTNAAIKDTTEHTNRMFDYQGQLSDLAIQHKGLDKAKLLEHAAETGQTDLEKAYNDLHSEDIIKAEVDRRVAEELTKRATDGITSGGHQTIVRTAEDTPKTLHEATEQILLKKAQEGTLA